MAEERSGVPARAPLDRTALERELARAVELQAATGDTPELLTEEQILEVGREVGLSPPALRQAIAEERSRIVLPSEEGTRARLFGPRFASATRTVRGRPEQVLDLLDRWMVHDECLQLKRRFADRVTWEARRDLWGNLKRGLNVGGRGYALARAHEVAATVVPIDDERVLVRLDADLSEARSARVRLSGATAATGVGTGGTFAIIAGTVVVPTTLAVALVAAVAAVPVLAGLVGAYAIARQHARALTRAQLALEQLLDRLEHGEVRAALPLGRLPW